MRKVITLTIIGIFIIAGQAYPAMKLYVDGNCKNCDAVTSASVKVIKEFRNKGELEIIDVTGKNINLPGLPALVDGKKVIIGTGLVQYLFDKKAALEGKSKSGKFKQESATVEFVGEDK